ncbi:hypothetical protein DRQ33_00025 [bacterium]|nr:MAG: hypothetical protein DRQ33_00025 [bacterium]
MKKLFFLLLLFSFIITPVPARDNNFETKLSERLSQKILTLKPENKIDILVWLTEPDGWRQRRAELEQMRGERRREYAVQSLKEFYFAHSTSVLELADRLQKEDEFAFGKHLWGGFSFSGKATIYGIWAIAQHPDVKLIMLDEPFPRRFMLPYDIADPFEKIKISLTNSEYATQDLCRTTTANAWQITHTNVDDAWSTGYTGEGVVVAIMDTGIDYDHPDLTNRMWTNPGETPGNGIDDDSNGYTDDYYGYDFFDHDSDPMDNPSDVHHGTMCAGMAVGDGASGWNTGAAPGARVMAIRVGNGSSFAGSSDEIDAFQYVVENGADVASMSYGSYPNNSVKDYYRYVINAIFGAAGVPLTVAAGNGNGAGGHYSPPYDISTPADIPPPWYNASTSDPAGPVLAVGATNLSDEIADFSSYGPTVWDFNSSYTSGWHDYPASSPLMKPDISAPGDNIITTSYGGGYEYSWGTSFSCPFLAGITALLLSKNGELTPREIDSVLEVTALDISDPGRDNYSGAGMVNADSALYLVSGKALAIDSVRFDDSATGDGDKNLDPGETGNVIIYVRNAGSASASDVQVTMTSVSNPDVSIVDANSSYGTMSPGETRDNFSDPIQLSISASANYTEYCMCYLNISDGSGYSRPDSFAFRIGIYPLEAMWHDSLATLYISITNWAGIANPGGMAWPWPSDSANLLYGAYPMTGNSSAYVADSWEDFWPLDSIWEYEPGGFADKETYTSCIDTTNDYYIKQYTYQWRSAPNEDFIIFFYKVYNRTASTLSGVRTGFYADFDISPYDSNYAVWDDANQWAYMYESTSGPYCGIVSLDGYNLGSVVDNVQYVYEDTGMGWTDDVKWSFLNGTYSAATGATPKDWSVILSFGPYSIPSEDFISYCAAIVAGNNLTDFQNNADQARTIYSSYELTVDDQQKIPEDVFLFGAHPNPFNYATELRFALTEPARVKLEIFDLRGRKIKTLTDEMKQSKLYSVKWYGCDETGIPVPTGIYFAKLKTEKTTAIRKLLLTK